VTSARILVVGSTGMVGRAVTTRVRAAGHHVVRAARTAGSGDVVLDLERLPRLDGLLEGIDVVVNAAGVLRNRPDYPGDAFRLAAGHVNTMWPLALAEAAGRAGVRVVHVSTDAVFGPGNDAADEATPAVPVEAYGQGKLLGESAAAHVLNLRCSVIGPAPERPAGLWEWLVRQPEGARVTGYSEHLWSGCTSGQLGHLVADLVDVHAFERIRSAGAALHFAPNGVVTKADVVALLAKTLRPDLVVDVVPGPRPFPRPLVSAVSAIDDVYSGPHGWAAAVEAQLEQQ
jgi:dTDP-4-dehydrorhamnose reductase